MASENDNNKYFLLKIEVDPKFKIEVKIGFEAEIEVEGLVSNAFFKIKDKMKMSGIRLMIAYSRFQKIFT